MYIGWGKCPGPGGTNWGGGLGPGATVTFGVWYGRECDPVVGITCGGIDAFGA